MGYPVAASRGKINRVSVAAPGGDTYGVAMNGTSNYINALSEASLDDVAAGAITVETWVASTKATGNVFYVTKSDDTGFILRSDDDMYSLKAIMYFSGGLLVAVHYGHFSALTDGQPHHLCFTFDNLGDRYIRLYLDGTLIDTSDTAANGTYASEATRNMYVARADYADFYLQGTQYWTRISNNIRYSGNFTPAAYNSPPASDANTVRLFEMKNITAAGTGVVLDSSANAQHANLI